MSSHTISTIRRPLCAAITAWRESAAGIDAAPGSVTPSASTAHVIVEAVPIVMQCPGERAMPFSISCQSSSVISPARSSAQYFQCRCPSRAWCRPSRRAASARPARRSTAVHRRGAHEQRGRRLVAAAHQHRAVDRIRAQHLLGLHREQVAVEHRRRLLERLRQRHRRHLEREPARLPHAALHVLDALLEVRVARVDVAPRVDDRDDRLAAVIRGVEAHLRGARAVAEGPQVVHAVPAVAAEFLGSFAGHAANLARAGGGVDAPSPSGKNVATSGEGEERREDDDDGRSPQGEDRQVGGLPSLEAVERAPAA